MAATGIGRQICSYEGFAVWERIAIVNAALGECQWPGRATSCACFEHCTTRVRPSVRDRWRYNEPQPLIATGNRSIGLGSGAETRLSRHFPVHPRHPADDVPRPPVDDAAVRRVRHGRRVEPALPVPARAGRQRPERRLRPADADGLRLGPSAGGRARSAASASRSTRSRTWRSCSTASRSTGSRRR